MSTSTTRQMLIPGCAAILALGWCFAMGATEPFSQPSTGPTPPVWRVTVTRAFNEGGDGASTFIVTVLNAGQTEETLYTPGVVGPILWPRTPFKGEPLEAYVTPRTGQGAAKDFVALRPGEGFSRATEALSVKQMESIRRVSAKLVIYEKEFEGDSRKVAYAIDGPMYDVAQPKAVRAELVAITDHTAFAAIDGATVAFDLELKDMLAAAAGGSGIDITGAWHVSDDSGSFYVIELNHAKYVRAKRVVAKADGAGSESRPTTRPSRD